MAAVPSIGRTQCCEADRTHALYEAYAGQIFRYCLHQLGSREEAEDAVQSTFLNAFRGIKRGVEPELESAWLFKIAHNVCLSRRRSAWRRGRIESPADFQLVEELAPAPSRRADELIGLQEALEQMPEQQRRAILLREWQGLSYREIAEELELSQAAVETLIFRGRRGLAQGLEQPPARRRAGAGAVGNLLSSLQSFAFGGGAAAKIGATVAVVGAGAVVASGPVVRHGPTGHTQPTPAAAPPPVRHATPTVDHRARLAARAPAPRVDERVAKPARPPGHSKQPAVRPAARGHSASPVGKGHANGHATGRGHSAAPQQGHATGRAKGHAKGHAGKAGPPAGHGRGHGHGHGAAKGHR